jgi:glycine cleavage system aminomethyltransferase T
MTSMVEQQRRGFERQFNSKNGVFEADRAMMLSPAAARKDGFLHRGTYFQWPPLLLPLEYTSWVQESSAHVESCYIGDWTALSKIHVKGKDALAFLSYIGMNSLKSFADGQVKHHVQLNETGQVASEGVVYRVGEEEFIYTGGGGDWALWQATQGSWDMAIESIGPDLFVFEVQGPQSLFVLERATGESLRDIAFNRSRHSSIDGRRVRVLRTGISGELGYELHGSADDAGAVWTAVLEAGEEFGIRQLGLRSMLVQHIEAGIATVGLDYLPASIITPGAPKLMPAGGMPGGSFVPQAITDYFRMPGELGWGIRRINDDHDFIGRGALDAQREAGGPARILAGLIWNAKDVTDLFAAQFTKNALPDPMDMPREIGPSFDQVLAGGKEIGVSSSRTYSTVLRETVSLVVIDKDGAEPGTGVTVLWGRPGTPQREIRAKVATLPLKPDRRRTDVSAI